MFFSVFLAFVGVLVFEYLANKCISYRYIGWFNLAFKTCAIYVVVALLFFMGWAFLTYLP